MAWDITASSGLSSKPGSDRDDSEEKKFFQNPTKFTMVWVINNCKQYISVGWAILSGALLCVDRLQYKGAIGNSKTCHRNRCKGEPPAPVTHVCGNSSRSWPTLLRNTNHTQMDRIWAECFRAKISITILPTQYYCKPGLSITNINIQNEAYIK